ncbi:ScbR family autoregulator-binding transcription factor [Actinophytocola gossypii]|uniref:TetR/AcrR family transcriptional regulator n=1 Tax=Actinophytocola gossypii TaxID=2812003 RepID=A0ABT2J5N1_9PSEU|nr:ScbR family autoregulator-binding transcription factor [Actinophytocola gossypii]MCT2582805.1 TetR/AcrR family transcriptional regulator [Actinophytocola gossypii]
MARQDRAERTRNAILDAAAEVFDERGFDGASLSDILARAGVTKGALYFHFSSKEELARALASEPWSAVTLPAADSDLGLQAVIDMSHALAHNIWTNVRVRAGNRLVMEANFASPDAKVFEDWIKLVAELLENARTRGDLRQEWDAKDVANWVSASFMGVQTQSAVLAARHDIHDRLTTMWRIALPGLVPPRRVARFRPAGTIDWPAHRAADTAATA